MEKIVDIKRDFEKLNSDAQWLKAIANPIRLCILKGLSKKGTCNVSYMQECLDIPQSTLSQNIQILKSQGIIKGKRDGNAIYYTIVDERVKDLLNIFDKGENSVE